MTKLNLLVISKILKIPIISNLSWMASGTMVSRIGSALTQFLLALLLFKEDFGVYAITFSAFSVFDALRCGGADIFLTQKGMDEFKIISPPAFWFALIFNIVIAGFLATAAPIAASIYNDSRIITLLLILAISVPLRTPSTILLTKLSIDLRFKSLSMVLVASSLTRFMSWIILAWFGFGPFSFVIPIPFIAIFESVLAYNLTKEKPWMYGMQFKYWKNILKETKWILFNNVSNVLFQNGDYMILGLFMPKGIVGVYYFAYELVAQIGVLLANNIFKVLFPSLVSIRHQSIDKQKRLMLQALKVMMFASPLLSMMIAINIPQISQLTGWQERFPGINFVVQSLALFFALRVLHIFTRSALMSLGRLKMLTLITSFQALGLLLVTALVAYLNFAIEIIALSIGFYIGIVSLGFATYALGKYSIKPFQTLCATLPKWLIAVVISIVVIQVDHIVGNTIAVYFSVNIVSVLRVVISSTLFMALFFLCVCVLPQLRNHRMIGTVKRY